MMKKYFEIPAEKYVQGKKFSVYFPAPLNNPKDNAVMFIEEKYMSQANAFSKVDHCLIFWPENLEIPKELTEKHAIVKCRNPHLEYCMFFRENEIQYLPKKECGTMIDSVFLAEEAVIGADGLSTDRDTEGKAATMPQFGSTILEDHIQIGANTVVARGAIDCTIIGQGAKIDNSCFISHNVCIGEDTFIVGETIMFGSSSTGRGAFISGNSAIRNGVHVGEDSLVGMGSVVIRDVADGSLVKGNPAK